MPLLYFFIVWFIIGFPAAYLCAFMPGGFLKVRDRGDVAATIIFGPISLALALVWWVIYLGEICRIGKIWTPFLRVLDHFTRISDKTRRG